MNDYFTLWWLERLAAIEAATVDPADPLACPELAAGGLATNNTEAVMDEVRRWGTLPVPDGHPHPLTAMHHGAVLCAFRCAGVWVENAHVVEFGGGFGSMAHVCAPFVERWTIVDHPVMLDVQRAYLAHHGVKGVKLSTHEEFEADSVRAGYPDLVIGLWSISEATAAMHEWLAESDWCDFADVFLAVDTVKDEFADGRVMVDSLAGDPQWRIDSCLFDQSVYVMRGI